MVPCCMQSSSATKFHSNILHSLLSRKTARVSPALVTLSASVILPNLREVILANNAPTMFRQRRQVKKDQAILQLNELMTHE